MKKLAVVFFVAFVTLFTARSAQAIGVGADLGYSRLLADDGYGGLGGDLYLRAVPVPLPLVDIELQLGLHRFDFKGFVDSSMTLIPIFVGGRVRLPIPGVGLFVGAHLGALHQSVDVPFGNSSSFNKTATDFAFNLGGGINVIDLPLVKIGVSSWFYVIGNEDKTKMLTVGLNVDIGT